MHASIEARFLGALGNCISAVDSWILFRFQWLSNWTEEKWGYHSFHLARVLAMIMLCSSILVFFGEQTFLKAFFVFPFAFGILLYLGTVYFEKWYIEKQENMWAEPEPAISVMRSVLVVVGTGVVIIDLASLGKPTGIGLFVALLSAIWYLWACTSKQLEKQNEATPEVI